MKVLLVISCIVVYVSCFTVELHRRSTLYIPQYISGSPVYNYDSGSIEQIAYDHQAKIVYAAGEGVFHIIDVSDPDNMVILDHLEFPNVDLTDVEFCGGYVFFAADNATDNDSRLHGTVFVLKKYDPSRSDSLKILHQIKVGAVPDMLHPTKDCKTVVVAIEAEAYGTGGEFRDPQGGVGVIRFPTGVDNHYIYTELDFTKFNSKIEELQAEGVRFVYRKDGNTFDRDVEPEYVTFNCDDTLAYIALQENNAIATVDLKTTSIVSIQGLGYKTWDKSALDTSDKDGGINLKNYDFIRSFYTPDAIHYHQWNGQNIIITANEGDTKDYEKLNGFNEEIRGNKFTADKLSDAIPAAIKTELSNNSTLGRLVFSNVDGVNLAGKHEQLYFYGGRSFTIRLASDMSVLYDSGDLLEKKIQQIQPIIFNTDGKSKKTAFENQDTRSDNKGPETEALETAEIGGRLVIFVGNERPGTIAVFSVGDNFTDVLFHHLYFNIAEFNTTFGQLYSERRVSEIDPEDIKYVPSSKSPTGQDVLFVAGSVSGTLSLLEVNSHWGVSDPTDSGVTTQGNMICMTKSHYNHLLRRRKSGH